MFQSVRLDSFTISARVPTSSDNRRFTSEVGAGSNEHCFAGAQSTIFVISSAVVSQNTDRQLHCRLVTTADDSLEVDARIINYNSTVCYIVILSVLHNCPDMDYNVSMKVRYNIVFLYVS